MISVKYRFIALNRQDVNNKYLIHPKLVILLIGFQYRQGVSLNRPLHNIPAMSSFPLNRKWLPDGICSFASSL